MLIRDLKQPLSMCVCVCVVILPCIDRKKKSIIWWLIGLNFVDHKPVNAPHVELYSMIAQ